jgi:hypothetical protein
MVFVDGHVEVKKEEDVNPPTDPQLTGEDKTIELWDPLQRQNPVSP